MEYSIQDIIDGAVEGEPTKVQAAFDHLIGPRIMDALEARKREVASSMFNSQEVETEPNDIEVEDEDTAPAAEQD
jgi:hypothetical protein